MDGEFQFVVLAETGLNEFRLEKYKESVRPVLYKNLDMLPLSIVKLIRSLDDYSYPAEHYGTWEEWLDDMSGEYSKLIKEIENQYERLK